MYYDEIFECWFEETDEEVEELSQEEIDRQEEANDRWLLRLATG